MIRFDPVLRAATARQVNGVRFDLDQAVNAWEGTAKFIIGDSVRALCLLARSRSRSYGIAVEDIEFSRKKAGLREYGTAHARRLSGWSYAKFFQVLEARCKRDGINMAKVNPTFTSVRSAGRNTPAAGP